MTGQDYRPSMGPPPFSDGNVADCIQAGLLPDGLQWGHRLSAMETLPPLRHCLSVDVPSMGPPPFSDGNWNATQAAISWTYSFNGATAFQRWKPGHVARHYRRRGCLQWGHRLSAMETWPTVGRPMADTSLQWGHRLSAMETVLGAVGVNDMAFLQWGHRLSAMETC